MPCLSCDRTVFSEHILNLCGTETTTEMFASRGFFVVLNDKWDPDPSVSINTSGSKDTWKLQFGIKHIVLIFEQTVFINKGLNFEITSKLPQSEEYNWGCAGWIYCIEFFFFFPKTFWIDKGSIHHWAVLQQRVFGGLQCAFGKLRSAHRGPNGRKSPKARGESGREDESICILWKPDEQMVLLTFCYESWEA